MEVVYVFIYLILCVSVAYFFGIEKRIGFGYSFLFSFFFTPILGILITFIIENIKQNKKPNETLKIIGALLFLPSIFIVIFFMFFFYNESKPDTLKKSIPDSIRIKENLKEGKIERIIYNNGNLLAKINNNKFILVKDSLIYKNYTSSPKITKSEATIQELNEVITKLEKEINNDIEKHNKPISKINKFNRLINDYNIEVKNLKTLISNKEAEYKTSRRSHLNIKD